MKQEQLVTAITKWVGIGVIGIQIAHAGHKIISATVSDQPQPGLTNLREDLAIANNSTNEVMVILIPVLWGHLSH